MTRTDPILHPVEPGRGWRELRRPAADGTLRPCLFLDRDGNIVEEIGNLHRVEEMRLIPGVARTIAAANEAGWLVVVVTNQGGVGRGLFGWDDFAAVQEAMHAALAAEGAVVDMVLASPWHREGRPPWQGDHPWRKPGAGMLLAAAEMLPIDLARSWIVGDHATDIMAGKAAGLRGGAHVMTGHGAVHRADALSLGDPAYAVHAIASLAEADRLLRA